MARRAFLLAASILSYMILVYLLPEPSNIIAAPLAAGALAALAGRSRPLHSLILGVSIGVVSYLAVAAIVGGLPLAIVAAMDLAGPIGVVAPLVYHGLGTGLVALIIAEVRGR